MSTAGRLDLETLKGEIEAGRIHTVIAAFPDLYGRLVGKRISGRFFLEETLKEGLHACDYLLACDMEMTPTPGYAYTSWDTGYGDLHAVVDQRTLRRLAWCEGSAFALCDCVDREGELLEVAPRSVLKRQLARLAKAGFEARIGSELEFFLFRGSFADARASDYKGLEPTGRYVEDYHILSSGFVEPVLGPIRRAMESSGVPVEFSKGEWGPGQHEINLRYVEALEMADRHLLYKLGAREIAAQRGHALSFMAKWDEALAGNSLHLHSSLWRPDGSAAFAEAGTPLAGTPTRAPEHFRHWLGGLLAHARELTLFFAPTVNSYKRYQAGSFAPTGVAWSFDNRTAGFRVLGEGASLRVECRIPGADANPCLAYAALIAAGLDGLEKRLDPGPAFEGDVYRAADLPKVPRTLPDAIRALEASAFARASFGDEVIEHLLHFARSEQAGYDAAVTDWERRRYFERI